MTELLNQLCSICHTRSPKYRCPACSTRTCSLSCVLKHKSRGCTGRRDPTSYIKKSALHTAAGVDHDYNFLVGIEQSRSRAESGLQGREIIDSEARDARLNAPAFRERLRDTAVRVAYAPLGMWRQRANQTRFVRASKRICWGVEWVLEDGSHVIDSLFDNEPLATGYRSLLQKRAPSPNKKRKRGSAAAISHGLPIDEPGLADEASRSPTSQPEADDPHTTHGPQTTHADDVRSDSNARNMAHPISVERASERGNIDPERAATVDLETASSIGQDQDFGGMAGGTEPEGRSEGPPSPGRESRSEHATAGEQTAHQEEGGDRAPFFYLLKPHTPGRDTVLIPLQPSSTLLTCLRDRTILEFPTIHVLSAGPDALPAGYMTESQFAAVERTGAEIGLKGGELSLGVEEGELLPGTEGAVEGLEGGPPTPGAVLAMLERDLKS